MWLAGQGTKDPTSITQLNGYSPCTQLAYLGRTSPKMVTLSSTINGKVLLCSKAPTPGLTVAGRGRHPALPADKPYLHNAVTYAIARMPISGDAPLCELAYRHRLGVRKGLELESMQRDLAVTREMCRRKYAIHICEPLELSYSVTNWCGAWRDIDFAPAVMRSEKTAGQAAPPSAAPLVLGHSLERNVTTRCELNTLLRLPVDTDMATNACV